MDERLYELLQDCAVKLSIPGKAHGTGFFVAPGLLLTCAHVIKGADDKQVSVFWPSQNKIYTAVIEKLPEDPTKFDLALLQVSDPLPNHPCVYLDESALSGDDLYSFGFLKDYQNGGPVRFRCEGFTGDQPPLIKFQAGQVQPGLSGAPLLNCRTGKVCGMVKETRDQRIDLGGGAVSAKVIFSELPELESKNRSFHEQQKDWVGLLPLPDKAVDFEKPQTLDLSDLQKLEELVTRSSQATTINARRALCQRIGIDANDVGFIEQGSVRDFANQLVNYLVNGDDFDTILRLCQEIKRSLKGRLLPELETIESKIEIIKSN